MAKTAKMAEIVPNYSSLGLNKGPKNFERILVTSSFFLSGFTWWLFLILQVMWCLRQRVACGE